MRVNDTILAAEKAEVEKAFKTLEIALNAWRAGLDKAMMVPSNIVAPPAPPERLTDLSGISIDAVFTLNQLSEVAGYIDSNPLEAELYQALRNWVDITFPFLSGYERWALEIVPATLWAGYESDQFNVLARLVQHQSVHEVDKTAARLHRTFRDTLDGLEEHFELCYYRFSVVCAGHSYSFGIARAWEVVDEQST